MDRKMRPEKLDEYTASTGEGILDQSLTGGQSIADYIFLRQVTREVNSGLFEDPIIVFKYKSIKICIYVPLTIDKNIN